MSHIILHIVLRVYHILLLPVAVLSCLVKLTKRLHLIHWLCNLYLFHAYTIETIRIPLCARYIYIIMHQFKMSSHVMTSILFYTRWFCYQNGTTRIVSSSVCYSAHWSAGFSHHQHYNWMVKFSCGPCCPARCGHCRLLPWRSPQLQFWWHSHMDNQLGECHPKAGRLTYLCFFLFCFISCCVGSSEKVQHMCLKWGFVLWILG